MYLLSCLLVYACLPAAFDKVLEKEKGTSIVVVVTPLLAIIHDQVDIQTSLGSRRGIVS